MNNFYDSQKTNVIFGRDTHKRVGEEIKKYGNTCLIVHDGGEYLTGILSDIRVSLETTGPCTRSRWILFWLSEAVLLWIQ